MRTLFVFLSLTYLLLFYSCHPHTEGSGNIITQTFIPEYYHTIHISGYHDVHVTQGIDSLIYIEGDDNIVSLLDAFVEEDVLYLMMPDMEITNASIIIQAEKSSLNRVIKKGDGSFRLDGFDNMDDLQLEHYGKGSVSLTGYAPKISVTKDGIGPLQAFSFTCDTLDISMDGLGNAEFQCQYLMKGSLEGKGHIFYKGQPTLEVLIASTGTIIDAN